MTQIPLPLGQAISAADRARTEDWAGHFDRAWAARRAAVGTLVVGALSVAIGTNYSYEFIAGDELIDVTTETYQYEIVHYGQVTPGLEKHHGVVDVWAAENIPNYVSRSSPTPTIALSSFNHDATRQAYRDWLTVQTGRPVGGFVDWLKVSPREMQSLSERMFDAAKVPEAARVEYYRSFNQSIYGASK